MAQIEVYHVLPENLNQTSATALLVDDEAHHLQRVRRSKPGEILFLIDGIGNAWKAEYTGGSKRSAEIKLHEHFPSWNEPRIDIHLGLGILKSDHFFEAINLTVQAGVCGITPLTCRHSIAGFTESKMERASRISLKATKQTGRGLIPPVHPVQHLEEWCIKMSEKNRKFFLDAEGAAPARLNKGESVALAVGPEGGFHPDEIEMMKEAGYEAISLGFRRLRAETAALLGVGILTVPLET